MTYMPHVMFKKKKQLHGDSLPYQRVQNQTPRTLGYWRPGDMEVSRKGGYPLYFFSILKRPLLDVYGELFHRSFGGFPGEERDPRV